MSADDAAPSPGTPPDRPPARSGSPAGPPEEPPAGPRPTSLAPKLVAGAVLGLLVYAGFVLWADLPGVLEAWREFEAWRLAPALGLVLLGYGLRFLRWERYRTRLGVELGRPESLRIFLAGLSLTVSPGKLGEAFKSVLVKESTGVPVTRTAPIVLAERLTDLVALLVLIAVAGLSEHPEHAWMFQATLAASAAVLAVLGSRRLSHLALGVLARTPVLRRAATRAEHALDSAHALLAPRELPLAVGLACGAWFLECVAFRVIASGAGFGPVPLDFAVVAFALPLVAGAVAMFAPGGLGVTEGLMVPMLAARFRALGAAAELARPRALSATILTRLCTLWFAMAVGLVALGWHRVLRRRARTDAAAPSDPAS